ncbi:MAG: DUF4097 family beta strand repeat-containing protein [Terriglobales bacterium]
MLNRLTKIAAVLLVVTPLLYAQETRIYQDGANWTREMTGSLPAARNLHIRVDIGSVRIEGGGSQQGISYSIRNRAHTPSEEAARRQFDLYKITASLRGDTAWIVGECHGTDAHKFSGEFVVKVPRDMDSIKVETEGGSVVATSVNGRFDTESGGGSIHLDDLSGPVNAETGGGSIEVGNIGGDITLHTGGGSIKVASAKGKINAETGGGSVVIVSGLQGAILETGGGNIQVQHCDGHVKASTGGGSIDLGDLGGPVEIETGGGSIRLTSAKGLVNAQTGSGSIELDGVPSARAETGSGGIIARFISSNGVRSDSVLQTAVGDITVYLSPNIPITIRASIDVANGHTIRSDFPEIRVASNGGEWGPKSVSAEGSLNGGGPLLKLRTSTGNIVLKRADR